MVGDAAGNQKVALNRAIGRSQGEFARIGVRRCRRNYQVAEGALVCRIAVMVNMKRHSHRGRQYRNDQYDRKDSPPDSIPINHEGKQLRLIVDNGVFTPKSSALIVRSSGHDWLMLGPCSLSRIIAGDRVR